MSEEITATMTYDLPTMLEGRRLFNRFNPIRRMMRSILITVISAAAMLFIANASAELTEGALYLSGALVIGWLFGTLFERLIYISCIKSSPLFGQRIVYTLEMSGLKIESSVSTSKLAWNAFLKTVGTARGTLLYQQKRIFNWLPKTAFASEADYTRFLTLLAAKTKHSMIN